MVCLLLLLLFWFILSSGTGYIIARTLGFSITASEIVHVGLALFLCQSYLTGQTTLAEMVSVCF